MILTRAQKNIVESNERVYDPLTEEEEYTSYIKKLLTECENTRGCQNKKGICLKIYRSLYNNQWLMNTHRKFHNAVMRKLHGFINIDQWKEITIFYTIFKQDLHCRTCDKCYCTTCRLKIIKRQTLDISLSCLIPVLNDIVDGYWDK